MKSRKRNIILIAWLQMILLLFPTAVKALHHHTSESKSEVVRLSHGIAFAKAATASSCPICDFEFVQFVAPEAGHLPEAPVSICRLHAMPGYGVMISAITLPSLRAPPVC